MTANEIAPLQVKAFDHITLVVKDLERSRKFYVDLLGMEQVDRPGFDFAGRWFQLGPQQIHLILEHENSGPAGIFVPEHYQSSRTHHFAFEVEDGHAAATMARELGIPLVGGPQERPDGAVQVFVNDTAGHGVQLCSPAR